MSTIALVGLPGSGKSSIGKNLAKRAHVLWVDTDSEVERKSGGLVQAIFDIEGEAFFRDLESTVLTESLDGGNSIVSTGGGMVIRQANRALLLEKAAVVYLHAKPEQLYKRLYRDTKRPLLQVDDPLKRLHELYYQRDPYYREVARYTVEIGTPSVSQLVTQIMGLLQADGLLGNADPCSA